MATNKDQMYTLTSAYAADAKTLLIHAETTAETCPKSKTMDESACYSYAKEGAERTAFSLIGGGIGAYIGYAACGTPGIVAAVQAGLCFLGGKKAAECCCTCDNSADNLLPVEPRAFALKMSQ